MKPTIRAGWATSTIGSVCSYIQRGKSPKYADHSGLPVINQKSIRWFGLESHHFKFVHPEQVSSWDEARYIKAGDVLWNSTGTGTVGRACLVTNYEARIPKVVDSHVTIVRPSTLMDPRYLFYWIKGPEVQQNIADMCDGTTNQIELNRTAIAALDIPLAPLAEQQRIADKLDSVLARVDAVSDRLARVAPSLKRFRQSVLAAATSGRLSDLANMQSLATGLGAGWSRVRLDAISHRVSVGHVGVTSTHYTTQEKGIPFLRSQNVRPGRLSADGLVYITKEFHESLRKSQLQAGDLLVVRVGANRGDSCSVPLDHTGPLNCANVVFARPKTEIVLPAYLAIYFQSPTCRETLLSASVGGAQGVINTSVVGGIEVLLPGLEEQAEIVRRVELLFAHADRLETRLQAAREFAERLTPSLLAKAFSGELVPQDPNDEPAPELMKRLANERSATGSVTKNSRGRKATRAVEDEEESSVAE